jgi:hypothetical protein
MSKRISHGLPACRGALALKHGGGERDRTDDLLLAKQALSQLSYTPALPLEAATHGMWWAWVDSNYRPHAYQACALTN